MEERSWSRRELLATASATLAGAAAGCSFGQSPEADTETPSPTDTPTGETPTRSVPQTGEVPEQRRQLDDSTSPAESTYAKVYQEVVDSVVAVRVRTLAGGGRGTAWIYDQNHLVTNQHVVADASSVSVWFDDDGWQSATVVGTDVYSDLAVLRVQRSLAESRALELVELEPPIGTEVVAIGNPFGLSGSLSTGVVSGRNRTLPAPNGFSIPDAVQTDAPVNPGNSGGPLVDLDGNVVGVINSGGGDNIGFAISAAMVERVVPSLIDEGSYDHSYMGVGLQEVTPGLANANDLPVSRGLYVDRVVDGGPSDGVLRGTSGSEFVDGREVDTGGDVIVRLGQTRIRATQTLSTFLALETSPGDTIAVEIVRDGNRQTVPLTLGARPPP